VPAKCDEVDRFNKGYICTNRLIEVYFTAAESPSGDAAEKETSDPLSSSNTVDDKLVSVKNGIPYYLALQKIKFLRGYIFFPLVSMVSVLRSLVTGEQLAEINALEHQYITFTKSGVVLPFIKFVKNG
jgi:hypothetical protein